MKTALITGVTSGIGRATAELFTTEGWRVVGIGRSAPATAPAIDRYVQLDLARHDLPVRIESLLADIDELSVLVNNAALQIKKPIAALQPAEWELSFATNVRPAFVISRAAQAALADARGAIVNVASVHAAATTAGMAAYAATKGALVAFTRAMALELGPAGIRVNAVLPGAVDTQMLRDGMSGPIDDGLDALSARTPLGRVGEPIEIARAILFLADEGASFVTGQALVVDGGALARLGTE
ncbi:MAG TPA: SDR family oxidoreductase [Candidatus Limnocylindria bacterium]|nr:SDR family oxidoreductase [Candidatus Limnocylindria bacterium]